MFASEASNVVRRGCIVGRRVGVSAAAAGRRSDDSPRAAKTGAAPPGAADARRRPFAATLRRCVSGRPELVEGRKSCGASRVHRRHTKSPDARLHPQRLRLPQRASMTLRWDRLRCSRCVCGRTPSGPCSGAIWSARVADFSSFEELRTTLGDVERSPRMARVASRRRSQARNTRARAHVLTLSATDSSHRWTRVRPRDRRTAPRELRDATGAAAGGGARTARLASRGTGNPRRAAACRLG